MKTKSKERFLAILFKFFRVVNLLAGVFLLLWTGPILLLNPISPSELLATLLGFLYGGLLLFPIKKINSIRCFYMLLAFQTYVGILLFIFTLFNLVFIVILLSNAFYTSAIIFGKERKKKEGKADKIASKVRTLVFISGVVAILTYLLIVLSSKFF